MPEAFPSLWSLRLLRQEVSALDQKQVGQLQPRMALGSQTAHEHPPACPPASLSQVEKWSRADILLGREQDCGYLLPRENPTQARGDGN